MAKSKPTEAALARADELEGYAKAALGDAPLAKHPAAEQIRSWQAAAAELRGKK
jgi:hypothetical protein